MAMGRVVSPGLHVNNSGLSAHLTSENSAGFVVTFSSFFVFHKFLVRSKLQMCGEVTNYLKRPNKIPQEQIFQNVRRLP